MAELTDLSQTELYDHCRARCEELSVTDDYAPNGSTWDMLRTHYIAEHISKELPPSARARMSLPSLISLVRCTLPVRPDPVLR